MSQLEQLVDAAARRAIREDLASTLVVEAAAGTGKTTEMIARIIAVIRSGAATLEQIAAVTFTEKAAGEMKLRLRTELERARAAASTDERPRFEAALAELEVARIGTIHAFCADLLRERPIEARVDPLFEVAGEAESEALFQQAFDRWFQATLAAPGEGVRRMLRRTSPTDQLRTAGRSLIQRRDFAGAWRRDPFDRDAAIDDLVRELAALGALVCHAARADDPLGKLCGRLDRWIADLGRREQVRPRDHDGLEVELAAIVKWPEWRYNGRTKLYGELPRVDVLRQRDAARAKLVAFREAADADLAALLHAELQPLVRAYVELESGRLDFFDLLERTRDLLRDDRTVREHYQRAFTHFFVDEFQDTDPLQVDILMLLGADDPALSDPNIARIVPGKLFVVGDPKQAIYRFRRADVALYEAVKQRLLADGARLVELTTSFRSVPAVQSVVNAAFAPVMQGDGQARYVPLAQHRGDVTDRPSVIALPVPRPYFKRDVSKLAIEDSYPAAVGAFIEWLVRDSRWTVAARNGSQVPIGARDICLIFKRFNAYFTDLTRPYVRALEARQIPHVLVGGRSFHEREEVEAVRSALAAIEWPDDELSVYATLRGPLFAFHDEDLLAFKHAVGRLHPLMWISPDGTPEHPAPAAPALREVAGALATLAELHQHRNRRPIADTLARLLATTRAHAGFAMWPAGEQALANVLRVMDLARQFEARRATSFRSFVDRLADDVERRRQPDALVVEEGTEGVRIMTVHAAKGLEFPVVILCDPTGTLAQERPSRHIDVARRVWLEPLAGCVPIELREHADEVLRRDREEGQRLAYVATTRARDLLVVPVVGDEERDTWLSALVPATHPEPARKRDHVAAPACPAFGEDSVLSRGPDVERTAADAVCPGLHVPRAGSHRVVWWDPRVLDLDRSIGGGMRQRQILEADETGELATASIAAHADWQARRTHALAAGARPSLDVQTVTQAAKAVDAGDAPVELLATALDPAVRAARPRGKRFGILVHAVIAAVDLAATPTTIAALARNHGRLVGASSAEIAAATDAVVAALAHPLLRAAAAAEPRGALRREVPIVAHTNAGMLEGIVDLAFADAEDVWTIVDFKTDADLAESRPVYENQVRLYAAAIADATGRPARAALLIV
ncbi:MAG TPA: UvrD-helicase domain-containing protein [Kofleriaceae bacterium]|nr:UvrD-helicase domain-containing protein [Kofleriaceae bacterium]